MSDTLQFVARLQDRLLPSDHDKLKCVGHSVSDIACRQTRGLLPGVDVLDTIALVLERRIVGANMRLPAIILALVLVCDHVAADARAIEISGNQPGGESDPGADLVACAGTDQARAASRAPPIACTTNQTAGAGVVENSEKGIPCE